MIKNYLIIALRNLRKYKFTSFINIFGLTVGLTCCLIISAYVINELGYDKSNPKAGQIYRVTRSFLNQDGQENLHLSSVAPPFGPLLQHEFPDIQKTTRLLSDGMAVIKYKEKMFNERGVYFADDNVFDFFPVTLVKGNPKTALTDPNCLLLSEEMAAKYFGDEDPINKLIKADNQPLLKVTGVYKAFPALTHVHPDMLMSFSTLRDSTIYGEKQLETNFGNNAFYTYLMFPKDYPVANVEAHFPAFIDKVMPIPSGPNVVLPPGFKQSKFTKLYLQKFTDIHLRSHLDDEAEPGGDINRVYIFSAIALFILLIACINYMNLSTARSILRAREIGVRKVVGAQRKEIIMQFLSESVLITWIALIIAFLLTWVLFPYINKLSGQHLTIQSLITPSVIVPMLLLPFVVGIVSGIYPAIFMSSFKPIRVLKGLVKVGKGGVSFGQVLVVFQFSISIILIIATTVVFQQLRYMQTASLGYNREHIITMTMTSLPNSQFETFRNNILRDGNVKDMARSSRIPTGRLLDSQGASVLSGDGKTLKPVNAALKFILTDYNFIPTYGIEMAAGRNFSTEYATDSTNYVINETAVKMLGWSSPEKAIGQVLQYGGVKGKVIGVAKDFHFESMHQTIIPLLIGIPKFTFAGNLSIKLTGNNIAGAIAGIKKQWETFMPETPFQYTFFDERFARLYESETQQGSLFTIFSFIAIFIACLGLFALSAFTITQRIKEIGIRKVLGASVTEIVRVLSVDFLKLVGISAIFAIPVAAFAMNKWLQDFAYRIQLVWWVFLMAAVLAAFIAMATISYQAIKAALSNPVKSLRTE